MMHLQGTAFLQGFLFFLNNFLFGVHLNAYPYIGFQLNMKHASYPHCNIILILSNFRLDMLIFVHYIISVRFLSISRTTFAKSVSLKLAIQRKYQKKLINEILVFMGNGLGPAH